MLKYEGGNIQLDGLDVSHLVTRVVQGEVDKSLFDLQKHDSCEVLTELEAKMRIFAERQERINEGQSKTMQGSMQKLKKIIKQLFIK